MSARVMSGGLVVVALLAGLVLIVGTSLSQEAATPPTANDSAAAGNGVRAQTPADQMANRVRSIRRNEYFYQSYGRRDLFSALVTGEFEAQPSAEIVDVNNATLVGVMWGATDKFALVEDGSGNGYILRVGDRVANGRVVAIQDNSLVASLSLYGITTRVILRLEDRKGKR